MKLRRRKGQKGQAVVEYIIIIVVVVIAALGVLTAFSNRLRNMIAGVANTFGTTEVDKGQSALETLKDAGEDGQITIQEQDTN